MGRTKKVSNTQNSIGSKTSAKERSEERVDENAFTMLEPSFSKIHFESFTDMAQGFDALITEFYRHYHQATHDEPNMFGFVNISHEVRFENIERMRTENVVGQKTTIIFAPVISGETSEERTARELRILAAFDPTKRPSHIMALNLLMTMLGKRGLAKLIENQTERGKE
jgi:hypothetical protein